MKLRLIWKSIMTHGKVCPKCGRNRVPWRDGDWACHRCDLIPIGGTTKQTSEKRGDGK